VATAEERACAECGREPRDDENPEEWRAYLDVDDGLPVFCPECDWEFDVGEQSNL
jgi:hypothetical protein